MTIEKTPQGAIQVDPIDSINSFSDLPDPTQYTTPQFRKIRSGDFAPDTVVTSGWDGSQYQTWVSVYDGNDLAIPDSVVTRTPDSNSNGIPNIELGARIEADEKWTKIGAKISSNTGSGHSTANIYRVSDGRLEGSADVSGLGAGDTFTVNLDNNIQPYDGTDATRYNFVLVAGSTSLTFGYYGSPSYPYTSSDGNLRIVAGAQDPQSTNPNGVWGLSEVGDVGF